MPETKHKLCLIINRLSGAGGAMDALTMAYALASRYEVTVVHGEKEKDEADAPLPLDESKVRFIKIHSLQRALSPVKEFKALQVLLRLLRKLKPHIVHTHGFKPGLLGRIAAKFSSVPVIVHTFHGHVFHSYYNRQISRFICFAERKLAALSTRIVAISPQQAQELSDVYRIAPKEKISIVFIGIDEQIFLTNKDAKTQLRKEYGISKEAVVVAIIGRLTPIKNHAFFVRIAQRILQRNQSVFFFIIGDGNQKHFIQKELSQHHILWQERNERKNGARVFFTGWLTDIASVLIDVDIVISTSLNEGTPVSLIEAQWMQKPVISTNVGGVRDTIINNETGFLIDDFDGNVFEEKIQMLIDNKRLREDMGMKGEAFVQERFSKEKEIAAMDALYKDCLPNKKS